MKDMFRMTRRMVPTLGLLLLVAAGCEELRIENGLLSSNGNAFSCTSEADCIEGFECVVTEGSEGTGGVCAIPDTIGNCSALYNQDGDNFLALDAPDECQGLKADCDDLDPLTYPDAEEVCDGRDNNCNGVDDVTEIEPFLCERQFGVCRDARTSCTAEGVVVCSEPNDDGLTAYDLSWQQACAEDPSAEGCDNDQPFQVDESLCDGLDNDCDGVVDEGCCNVNHPFRASTTAACTGPCNERDCQCQPGQAFGCSRGGQTCERGVVICEENGTVPLDRCMAVEQVPNNTLVTCNPNQPSGENGCGADEVCIGEFLSVTEDFSDDCDSSGDPGCERFVCRALVSTGDSCSSDSECSDGFCYDGECRPEAMQATQEICNGLDDNCDGVVDNGSVCTDDNSGCPFNMVRMTVVAQTTGVSICVDRYEASRWDAVADEDDATGSSDLYAVSRPNVMPWTGVSQAEAEAHCEAQGWENQAPGLARAPDKVLCGLSGNVGTAQWQQACGGVNSLDYNYCVQGAPCTYQDDTCVDGRDGVFSVQPTGSRAACAFQTNSNVPESTIFDMTGNVWEWTAGNGGNSARPWLVGGSYAWPTTGTPIVDDLVPEGAMVCEPENYTAYRENPTTPLPACTVDSDCAAANRPFARCNAGQCEFFMDQLPDPVTGDWSDYDNVGFRCCATPN